MNIFQKIMADEAKAERSLGNPLYGEVRERRLTLFAQATGGKGFRVPATSPNGKRAKKKASALAIADRQHRKELDIGVDPIFKPKGQRLGMQARKDWLKASKAWDEANA